MSIFSVLVRLPIKMCRISFHACGLGNDAVVLNQQNNKWTLVNYIRYPQTSNQITWKYEQNIGRYVRMIKFAKVSNCQCFH